jgi:ABC-type transport system involved in cytochrome bd biosynthesis fused ATPase/permease subunit
VKGLVGRYGTHEPLSFVAPPGKVVAIVGPTGIGKTSLLRALLGLEAPREGTTSWGDEELALGGVGPSERPFAWVPQDAPVLGDTLVANIVLGVQEEDAAAGDDATRAARVLADLGAGALVASVGDAVLVTHRAVSGGERQWIAVARALATRLPVLLLDEPTSSLDGAAQDRMLAAIAGLRGKRTVVIVTHRPEPLAIADVVVRLSPASDGENAQHRARRDDDVLGSQELSIEDIGAAALEAQVERPRERVDVPGAE